METILIIIGSMLLGYNLNTDTVETKVITKEVYKPIPEVLLNECKAEDKTLEYYSDLVSRVLTLEEALELCNTQLEAIKKLQ